MAFDNLSDAARALRKSGMRLSTPRRLVLEALFAAEGPVSATHLARELSLDESSVYRNLEALEHHGLVRHVHLGHSPGLYVLVGHDEVEYLYCDRCAKVTTVSPDGLDAVRLQIKRQFGYTARFTHFAIVGVCEACATDARSDPRRADDHAPAATTARTRHQNPSDHDHTGAGGQLHSHGGYVHAHTTPGR
jgi:Fur family transcriptional regulator, ferric uptake regulator